MATGQLSAAEWDQEYRKLRLKCSRLIEGITTVTVTQILFKDNPAIDGHDQCVIFETENGLIVELHEQIPGLISRHDIRVGCIFELVVNRRREVVRINWIHRVEAK